jgi:hypothetical protein
VIAPRTPDRPAVRWNTPRSRLSMRMLEASDAIATSTNLLNLLPTVVRSLLWTAATILDKTEVI